MHPHTSTTERRPLTVVEPQLVLAKSSIDGLGVFSLAFIPAGAAVIECGGLVQVSEELSADARAMQIGPNTYLVEDPKKPCLDDFLNHSCKPNLGFVDGSLTLYALGDIRPGEELTFDYSTSMDEPGWKIRCRCRARNCRRAVRSYSELPKRLQQRLRQIALAYLR